jgi:hypothetical protein
MTPTPEQLEHIKISQRASLRNAQTFSLFAAMVAGGKRPDEALKDAEGAIDAWSEYEDAHAIEPPPAPGFNELLSKLGNMADKMGEKVSQRDNDNSDLYAIHPRDIIEASRDMARTSRDMLAPALRTAPPDLIKLELQSRMNLVMDCFNTGAATMLKMLHGDTRPEPWSDNYDHEERLRGLLEQFGLLCEEESPSASPSTDPSNAANGGSPQ